MKHCLAAFINNDDSDEKKNTKIKIKQFCLKLRF